MKILVVVMIVLFLFVGCRTDKQANVVGNMMSVPWPPEHPLSTAELIDGFEYIPLEVSDSALFGHMMACNYTPDKFFILGNEQGRNIKVFDASGKYLNSIGAYGRGPGEYANVFNWSIRGDSVFIGDLLQRRFLVYREDGQLLQEKHLPDSLGKLLGGYQIVAIHMHPLKNGYFVQGKGFSVDQPVGDINDFVILDQDLQVKSLSLAEAGPNPSYEGLFAYTSRQLDTIYLINENGEIARKVHIDFPGEQVTSEVRKKLTFSEISKLKSFVSVSYLVGDYLLLDMMNAGKRVRAVLNWKNGQVYLNDEEADVQHKILNFAAISSEEQSVVSVIISPENPGFKELPVDLQTSLEEEGGMVFVKYKLK